MMSSFISYLLLIRLKSDEGYPVYAYPDAPVGGDLQSKVVRLSFGQHVAHHVEVMNDYVANYMSLWILHVTSFLRLWMRRARYLPRALVDSQARSPALTL